MSVTEQAIAEQETILLRRDESGVTTLTLNRPNQFNALSMAMLEALQAELDAIALDQTVRVVILALSLIHISEPTRLC